MKQFRHWITLLGLLIGLSSVPGVAAEALLRDGFQIRAQDGALVLDTDTGDWFFQFEAGLFDGKQTAPPERRYALLPGNVFASLLLDQQKRSTLEYRLWAQVTEYRGANYLYVTRFQPLRKTTLTAVAKPNAIASQPAPDDDPLHIPEAIERDRRTRPLVDRSVREASEPSQPDGLMLDRVGYITRQEDDAVFVLDGLGRTLNPRHLEILPNRLLDTLEQEQAAGIGRMHIRIVALISEHQGREHLLLLRATRVYPYGNFGN